MKSSLLLLLLLSPATAAPATATPAAPAPAPPAAQDPAPALVPPAHPDPPAPYDPQRLQAALADLPSEPSLAEIQRAALRSAGLEASAASGWRRRSRAAAALPTLTLQYDHRLDEGWTLDQEAGTADALSNDGQHQSVIRLRASWELDRLIYSPDELRVARAQLDLDDWRARVLVEITALYFERQRLLLERRLQAPTDLQAAIAAELRLREIEGLLAALTGLELSS